MLVETNRAPFDLPEAEAELVAGFNVEYSASTFALFFLSEYNSMIVASVMMVILFFGGDSTNNLMLSLFNSSVENYPYFRSYFDLPLFFLLVKTLILCYSFVFVRANFPRIRYDQLQMLGWKVCLPIGLSLVYLFVASLITFSPFLV